MLHIFLTFARNCTTYFQQVNPLQLSFIRLCCLIIVVYKQLAGIAKRLKSQQVANCFPLSEFYLLA